MRRGEKKQTPLSSVWHHTCTVHSPWQEHTQITANSPKTSHICTTNLPPLLCLSYLPLSPFFSAWPFLSPRCVAVIFHRSEQAEAVNTPLLGLRTQCDPTTSVSLTLLPRSLIPRPLCLQLSGCSAGPVIHQPARSPARGYWFLFPQSPRERERKD